MTAFVALIRAANVGGTGKLPKDDLKALGESCGFANVRTFINSGNLLFTSVLGEEAVQRKVAEALEGYFGKPTKVLVRSAAQMAEAAAANPFSADRPAGVMANFIDEKPVQAMLNEARDVQGERMALGPRLIYVSYGQGMANSKLKLPALKRGTARNMNSVGKIAELLAEME